MDISFNELRSKDVINLSDGSRIGRFVDIVFNHENGGVTGFVVPGEKKLFKRTDDIFVPVEKVRRIGEDVILVRLEVLENISGQYKTTRINKKKVVLVDTSKHFGKDNSYIRYRKLDNKKYK